MKRLALSRAASGLVRALLCRVPDSRDRILLSEIQSSDWHSLTLAGERHVITLRIIGDGARLIGSALTSRLADHEFSIPGIIVADIAAGRMKDEENRTVSVQIEALTIEA